MRVAVTGASGFVGTALVEGLVAAGHEVHATDRYPPARPLPGATFTAADVLDRRALARVVEGAEHVFHMAALASIARAPEGAYQRVNVDGTDRVLEAARAAGARSVVHMSSSTVYGIPDQCPVPEGAPLAPACPYSRSKAAAEAVCARHADDDFPIRIIRPRVVVGPGRAGIFALFFSLVRSHLPVPLVGSGANLFQLTDVADLVAACLRAAEAEAIPGRPLEIFNIGSDVRQPLADELRAFIRRAGSRSRLVPLPRGPFVGALRLLGRVGASPLVPEQYRIADADFVLDTSHARERLGFVPASANGDGLWHAWTWWREHEAGGRVRDVLRWIQPRHQNATQRRSGRPRRGG